MPDLAYAQAQRELATTAATKTTAAAVPPSPPQQETTQTCNFLSLFILFIYLVTPTISSSIASFPSQTAPVNPSLTAISTTTAIHDASLFLPPKIPIFDPKRPPPPINFPIFGTQSFAITPPSKWPKLFKNLIIFTVISSSGLLTAETRGPITQVTNSINSAQQPKGLVNASPLSSQVFLKFF